ncbi:MAG: membrane associated rhomboid family serine protease [Bacteriovoracaceae bacterium]|jgi:membrane associated rhomboid family serine protease
MQGQMYIPPLTKINKMIIIGYVGMFILSNILRASAGVDLLELLGLTASGLQEGNIFQLMTFPFVDKGLMSVVFNALILWFIGSELESKWGAKFYLKFLAVATYSCGFLFALITFFSGSALGGSALFGLSGTNLALLVGYGIIYSERTMVFMFIFPMKAKYFCLLLAGIEMFMALSSGTFNSAWGHLIAMATGFGFLRYEALKRQGLGVKDIIENHKSHKARKNRGNLRLVKPEDEKHDPEDPKYWQ